MPHILLVQVFWEAFRLIMPVNSVKSARNKISWIILCHIVSAISHVCSSNGLSFPDLQEILAPTATCGVVQGISFQSVSSWHICCSCRKIGSCGCWKLANAALPSATWPLVDGQDAIAAMLLSIIGRGIDGMRDQPILLYQGGRNFALRPPSLGWDDNHLLPSHSFGWKWERHADPARPRCTRWCACLRETPPGPTAAGEWPPNGMSRGTLVRQFLIWSILNHLEG